MDHALQLAALATPDQDGKKLPWRQWFTEARASGGSIVLYGAGNIGQQFAELILRSNEDFDAFCDRNKAGSTFLGKPVLSPETILCNPEHYYVAIAVGELYFGEILGILKEHCFHSSHIFYHNVPEVANTIYQAFSRYVHPDTAIVDAGCFDGADSIFFARLFPNYSEIYAFEPDRGNYELCLKNIANAGIIRAKVIPCGLSATSGEASFLMGGQGSSYLLSIDSVAAEIARPAGKTVTVQTNALDDVFEGKLGFMKMDIEGAEFDALHGAERTIRRDRPLLAISVYHRRGDLLAIMDYLNSIVPEYSFWLRHSGGFNNDTMLFAAVR
ncbi:MAG: FkbM family methyltransferase [Acidaminococcaceae bacterium]|nr:FkbM family methyltransferase [Acidaminococcaceae bacterium]